MSSCPKGSSGSYPTNPKRPNFKNYTLNTNWKFKEKTPPCSIPHHTDKVSCESHKGVWTPNPTQKNTFVKFDKLSPAIGQDILWGQQGDKHHQVWPYDMNHNQIGILPCSDFNKGYTGNISAKCNNGNLEVDLSRCKIFNGCLYGKTNVKGDKRVACYSAMKGKDALCHYKKPGQYRCFCPPNYYGDGVETSTKCTQCPQHSSNQGIDQSIWNTYKSEKEWLQMGPGAKDFPNSHASSCKCNPGYESKLNFWLRKKDEAKLSKKPYSQAKPTVNSHLCQKIECPSNSGPSKRKPPNHCVCNNGFTNQNHTYGNTGWILNVSGDYLEDKTKTPYRIHQINETIHVYDSNENKVSKKNTKWDGSSGVVHIEWTNGKKVKYKIIVDTTKPNGKIQMLQDVNKKEPSLNLNPKSQKPHNLDLTGSNPLQPWIGECKPEGCLIHVNSFNKRNMDPSSCNNIIKDRSNADKAWGVFPSGSSCQPKCNPGFSLKGNTITCNNGQLQMNAQCTPNRCTCKSGKVVNQADCDTDGSHLCQTCNSGYLMFNPNKKGFGQCEKPTDCQKGEYIQKKINQTLPITKGDRQCSPCSQTQYQTSLNQDKCLPHTQCKAGEQAKPPIRVTEDVTCQPCTKGTFKNTQGNNTCQPKKSCNLGQFVLPSSINDKVNDTVCKAVGQNMITNPNIQWKLQNTNDTEFKLISPKIQMVSNQTVSCKPGYHLILKSDYDKLPVKNTQSVSAIKEQTTAFCEKNLCICAANVCKKPGACRLPAKVYNAPNIQNRCLKHNSEDCVQCNAFQHWDTTKSMCTINTCKCKNGVPLPSGQCTKHDQDECLRCNPGYNLTANKQCVAWGGSCLNGKLIDLPKRKMENHCGICDKGYTLDKTKKPPVCVPSGCKTSAPTNGTIGDCPPLLGHGKTCQIQCNAGYETSGKSTCDKGQFKATTCQEKPCPVNTQGPKPKDASLPQTNLVTKTKMDSGSKKPYSCDQWNSNYTGQIDEIQCSKGKVSITKGNFKQCKPLNPCDQGKRGDLECQLKASNCVFIGPGQYNCECKKDFFMSPNGCQACPNNTKTLAKGSTDSKQCNQCDAGKHYDSQKKKCIDNVCLCPGGIPEKGVKCKKHNEIVCSRCLPTHTLTNKDPKKCQENHCDIQNQKPKLTNWWGDNSSFSPKDDPKLKCNVSGNLMSPTSGSTKNDCQPNCNPGYSNTTSVNKVQCAGGIIKPIQCSPNVCKTLPPNCDKPVQPGHPFCITGSEPLCSSCKPGYRIVKTSDLQVIRNDRTLLNAKGEIDFTNDTTVQKLSQILTATTTEIKQTKCECIPFVCECKDKKKVVGPPSIAGKCPQDKQPHCQACYSCNSASPTDSQTVKNDCRRHKTKQMCESKKVNNRQQCSWENRTLMNNQCIPPIQCKPGEKYVPGPKGGSCVPCEDGTYQNKKDHRETTCIPQNQCPYSDIGCKSLWKNDPPMNPSLPYSCYTFNRGNTKINRNTCLKNNTLQSQKCVKFKMGATLKNQCIECEKGYHLIKASDKTYADKAYCMKHLCLCKMNQCICPDRNNPKADKTKNATSGAQCTSDGNVECKGCGLGFHSQCPPGQKPSADYKSCIPSNVSNRVTDCSRNICSCPVVIKQTDIGSQPPPQKKEGEWDTKTGWNVSTDSSTKLTQWEKMYPQGAAKFNEPNQLNICKKNGTDHCLRCPKGFKKSQENTCVPMNTTCPNGAVSPIFNAKGVTQRIQDNQCFTCNRGFRLVYVNEPGIKDNSRKPTRTPQQCLTKLCECVPENCSTAPLVQALAKSNSGTKGDCPSVLSHNQKCKPKCNPGFHFKSDISCSNSQLSSTKPCDLNVCICPNGKGNSGTSCPTHGSESCALCNAGYFLDKDKKCKPIRNCGSDEYEKQSPSPTQNRVCEKLTICSPDEFETKAPTQMQNRVCQKLTICPPGKYLSGQSLTKNGTCQLCPTNTYNMSSGAKSVTQCLKQPMCQPGNYIANSYSNVMKKQCKPCPSGTYSSKQDELRCSPLTVCKPGETLLMGTKVMDTVCKPPAGTKPCPTSPPSNGTIGDCPPSLKQGQTCRVTCNPGYSMKNTLKMCQKDKFVPGVCDVNVCPCQNGVAQTSPQKPNPKCIKKSDGSFPELCAPGKCNPGYYLDKNSVCVKSPTCQKEEFTPPRTAHEINQGIPPKCQPLTKCSIGSMEPSPYVPIDGTAIKDRVCKKTQVCSIGEKTTDINLSNGRGYKRTCEKCQKGEYGDGQSCIPQKLCKAGQETITNTLDNKKVSTKIIKSCKNCKLNSFTYTMHDEKDYDNLNVCQPQVPKQCPPGQKTMAKDTFGTLVPWDNTKHQTTHQKICQPCPSGTYSTKPDSSQCIRYTECKANEYEFKAPTSNSDRVCKSSVNCKGGTLMAMKDKSGNYIRTKNAQCGSCDEGYHLRIKGKPDDTAENTPKQCEKSVCTCLPNKCICKRNKTLAKRGGLKDGSGWGKIPVTERCYVHKPKVDPKDLNDSDCIGCPPGFWLNPTGGRGGKCEPNKCSCPVTGSVPASDRLPGDKIADVCRKPNPPITCNRKVYKQLQPYDLYSIWTGNNPGRALCPKDGMVSCGKCPAGYELTISKTSPKGVGTCTPWSNKCRAYDLTGKMTQKSANGFSKISDRIMDDQCAKCDKGFRLVKESDYQKDKTGAKQATLQECKQTRCVCVKNNCQCKTTQPPYTDVGKPTTQCDWKKPISHKGETFTQSCDKCQHSGYSRSGVNCIVNKCTCQNGTAPPTGDPRCKKNNSKHCITCDPGYKLVNNTCIPYGGICRNGNLPPQKMRTQDNECIRCRRGYHLDNKQCKLNVCACQNGSPATGVLCPKHGQELCVKCNPTFDLLPDFDRQLIKQGKFIQKSNKTCQKQCNPKQFYDQIGLPINLKRPIPGDPKTYVKKICDQSMKSQSTCIDTNGTLRPPLCHTNYQLSGGRAQTHVQPRCYDGQVYFFEQSCIPKDWKFKGTAGVTVR
jgi:hypothetical protein